MMTSPRVGWVVMLLACAGCAAAPPRHKTPGVPVVQFPSRENLASLKSDAAPERAAFPTLEVQEWPIETASPKAGAPATAKTAWDLLLEERRSKYPGTQTTPPLACAARETARFHVTHAAYPDQSLRSYIVLRCGGTLPDPSLSVMHFEVPEGVSEAAIEKQFAPNVRDLVASLPESGNVEAGIGYARANGRAAIVLYYGAPVARLQGFDPVALGLGVTLSGELESPAEQMLAFSTRGRLGVRSCEGNRSVLLPRFEFFCPLDPDGPTRIQVVARRPQRALFETVLAALERRSDDDGARYQRVLFGPDTVAPDDAAFGEALRGALSEARRAAGVAELGHEVEQSKTNDRLAPELFRALQHDRKVADTLALGLLAGWEVKGSIRSGGILLRSVAHERRPARWLAQALEEPFGRHILLDADVSRVAVGTAEVSSRDVGAVVTVYSLLDATELARARETIVNELNRDRTRYGKRVAKFVTPSPTLSAALSRIEKEGISAQAALQDVIADLRWNGQSEVAGFSLETIDVKATRWPAELLMLDELEVELGLTHYKPEGAAWGQYAALFLVRRKQLD